MSSSPAERGASGKVLTTASDAKITAAAGLGLLGYWRWPWWIGQRPDPRPYRPRDGMELSARSIASLFAFRAPIPAHAPPCLVLNGDRDKAVPAWATRLFTRWSRLPNTEVRVIADAGHDLFLDQLDRCVPLVADWLDAHLASAP